MRPPPRILLEAAVAAAVSEYRGIVKHFSPPPLSTASPPPTPPPCVTHACRWWPYSGSKQFEANAAMVIIILLSALICALGLNSVIRCFLRSTHLVDDEEHNRRRNIPHELARMQLKTNAAAAPCYDGGPTLVYSPEMKAELAGAAAECAICLSEFVDGEGIRVLERCKHGFHSHCIQAWLSSHSSCPTCRRTCLPPSPPHPPQQSTEVDQPPLPESTGP